MWETIRNAWKIADLRKKILYTLGMLMIYRLLCFVPTPGVDISKIAAAMEQFSLLGFINSMTGSNMDQFTIMAMGITPYINASIIMQLLTVAIPKLEALQKEGDEGRKKIAQITRYVTVVLGFFQASFLAYGLGASRGLMQTITIGLCIAAGTTVAMWIGERITDKGIGNGISLLIFAGIVSRVGPAVILSITDIFTGKDTIFIPVVMVVVALVLIIGVVYVDMGERRINVQYAKRMVGRKMYGGQSTHIPMKVNSSGVLPLIFASSIMQFPSTILGFFPGSGFSVWWSANISPVGFWYQLIFALMIVGFTFFYNSISFNPIEMSKNMQQNGGMIPGIRQGKPTSDFLARISKRITLFGALFLAVLATIPTIVAAVFGRRLPFAATSLLIAVSVALETTKQLESQMLMRHYKGFLR